MDLPHPLDGKVVGLHTGRWRGSPVEVHGRIHSTQDARGEVVPVSRIIEVLTTQSRSGGRSREDGHGHVVARTHSAVTDTQAYDVAAGNRETRRRRERGHRAEGHGPWPRDFGPRG